MENRTQEIYSEVYTLLHIFGPAYIDKLPNELYNNIKENRNKLYDFKYEQVIDVDSLNIKRETKAIIAILKLYYWSDSEEEQQKLIKIFKDNEEKYQNEIKTKYNYDMLFENENYSKNNKKETGITENTAIVEYKESIFKKIINKIKFIFTKNKS